MRLPHLAIHFSLVCLASIAAGQGSAGNYGQGMGGGGGGGFGGYRVNGLDRRGAPQQQMEKQSKPDEDETYRLWETKSAILTPGDRVEFKLNMKKGQTLLASVTSDAFDPALAIEDSKGKRIAENDDRAEGDQSPFLAYRFTEDGAYLLKVLSFHSVAGGKFTIKMRTFFAADAPIGEAKHENVQPCGPEPNGPVVFRIQAKKSKIYDLGVVLGLRETRYNSYYLRRLVGPTGVEANDFSSLPNPDNSPVFQALADGDYYAEYESYGARKFTTAFREVAVVAGSSSETKSIEFEPSELKVVEFAVKPDLIVRTKIESTSVSYVLSGPGGDPMRSGSFGDETYGNVKDWTWFRMNRDSDADTVRIFHFEGKARLILKSRQAAKVTVANSESLPAWPVGKPLDEKIGIGDSRLYLIQSSKSELMRVRAAASHIQPRLEIFRLSGELANSLCDRKTHTAGDDLYFPDAGTFIVRFLCDGNGGSGDFSLKRQSIPAEPYKLGSPTALKLDGVNFGLYSVDLEAGKRYELIIDHAESYTRVDLLDEDGQFLTSPSVDFDKVQVFYFVPLRSGRHRLWLRGAPGMRHFKFERHIPPTIG